MRRIPWWRLGVLLSLLAGFGLGLAYSWVISPTRVIDSAPIALRADFKDSYRSAIAAAFAGTGNLTRAQSRLGLLGDSDPVEALNAQAQRMIASGEFQQADRVAALAFALESGTTLNAPLASSTIFVNSVPGSSTATISPPQTDVPFVITESPAPIETQTIILESTPRPTRTPLPTLGAPFALTSQEPICDTNLPDGLLQVIVLNSNRRQLAGAEIRITWDGGEEKFFTGLKPELGNGYADFIMSPNATYAVQLGLGSDVASGLIAPACQTSSGDSFTGGYKLTFQQP